MKGKEGRTSLTRVGRDSAIRRPFLPLRPEGHSQSTENNDMSCLLVMRFGDGHNLLALSFCRASKLHLPPHHWPVGSRVLGRF